MSDPIVFISNQKIKKGALEEYTQYYREVAEFTEANKPDTLAHTAFASEDGTAVSIVHIFPDAEAMQVHMRGVGELANKAYQWMEIVSFEIYGKADPAVVDKMKQIAGPHIAVGLKPLPLGNYMRLKRG